MVDIDPTSGPSAGDEETRTRRTRVVVIGAGFGGIGTAVRLKQSGIDDFVVLERAAEPGGTWQVNTYPGAQCDIPSILYSFSFAPNPNWTRLYPLQPEIYDYLRDCVHRFGLAGHFHCNQDVTEASWDEQAQIWRVHTAETVWEAQFLVAATGPFSAPATPDLLGLESFRGQMFHTADWNHDHDLRGERIAVVGTGASAVQIIPRLQPLADTLTVFQRTPTWILPHPDQPMTGWPSALFERVPLTQRLARKGLDLLQEALVPGFVYKPSLLKGLAALGRAHLRRQVRDPDLRAKLLPHYAFGCKRPTFSNTYYPALASPNVEVVTDGIVEVQERGVLTADGAFREVDTIVMGTGFRMGDNPSFDIIRGQDGRSLAQTWNGSAEAFLGTTISGFPNFFMILGPNSVVYTSQVVTIEAQVEYIVSCILQMDERGIGSIDVRADVQREFVRATDRRLATSVWNAGGCSSYYLVDGGRNYTFYPGFNRSFRARTKRADLAHYAQVQPASSAALTTARETVRSR
jgi:cation diffusion facilitator CzcD-associated flavoprotein CzcO